MDPTEQETVTAPSVDGKQTRLPKTCFLEYQAMDRIQMPINPDRHTTRQNLIVRLFFASAFQDTLANAELDCP
jgi:hypothetical protein